MTEVIRPDSVVVTAPEHHFHSNIGVSPKDAVAFASNAGAQRAAFTDRGVSDMSMAGAQRSSVTDREICGVNQQVLLQGQRNYSQVADVSNSFGDRIAAMMLENQKNTAAIMLANKECCCEITAAVVEQGNSTRELLQKNLIEDLRFRLARALPTPAPPL